MLAVADRALPMDRARLQVAMARMAEALGAYEEAEERYREALTLARAEGDAYVICQSLEGLGGMAQDQGRFDEAREMHEEVLATSARRRRRTGSRPCLAPSRHHSRDARP